MHNAPMNMKRATFFWLNILSSPLLVEIIDEFLSLVHLLLGACLVDFGEDEAAGDIADGNCGGGTCGCDDSVLDTHDESPP